MPLLLWIGCRVEEPADGFHPPPTDHGDLPDTRITDLHAISEADVPADVLVAVDPTPVAQGNLEEVVLPELLRGLDRVNASWRVAITSTALGDVAEAGFLAPTGADGGRWLTEEDLDDPSVDWSGFPAMPPFGATGATWYAATLDLYEFRRPEATLHLVLMGLDFTPDTVLPFDAWASWVAEESAVVSALTFGGMELAVVVIGSGGLVGDPLGDLAAWGSAIGFLPSAAPSSFAMSRLPQEHTLEVQVETPDGATFEFFEAEGDPPAGDWTYAPTANAVAFTRYVPENGALVLLSYEPRN